MAKKKSDMISREVFKKAGKKGGKTTVQRHGKAFMKKIAIEREKNRKKSEEDILAG